MKSGGAPPFGLSTRCHSTGWPWSAAVTRTVRTKSDGRTISRHSIQCPRVISRLCSRLPGVAGIKWLLIAIVLFGTVPAFCSVLLVLLAGVHRWFDHAARLPNYELPRIAVLIPAWNEANVL